MGKGWRQGRQMRGVEQEVSKGPWRCCLGQDHFKSKLNHHCRAFWRWHIFQNDYYSPCRTLHQSWLRHYKAWRQHFSISFVNFSTPLATHVWNQKCTCQQNIGAQSSFCNRGQWINWLNHHDGEPITQSQWKDIIQNKLSDFERLHTMMDYGYSHRHNMKDVLADGWVLVHKEKYNKWWPITAESSWDCVFDT